MKYLLDANVLCEPTKQSPNQAGVTESRSSIAVMNTINTTINIGEDSVGILAKLLSQFTKGQRVQVAVTVEPPNPPLPTLVEFTNRIDAACRELPPSPWATAEEAMHDLREGDRS